MNAKAAKLDSDLTTTDIAKLGGLDDWAVNELRNLLAAGKLRWRGKVTRNQMMMISLVKAEQDRVRSCKTCLEYLKASRIGSYYQINRQIRFYVYMVLRARWRMEELGADLGSTWHK